MKDVELLKRFVGVGYFPKELPPPFTSSLLAQHLEPVTQAWPADGRSGPRTRSDVYSIPRYGRNRRRLSVPNPVSHFYLSKHICENWETIVEHVRRSNISLFKPDASREASRVFDPVDFDQIEARKNSILSRCDKALMIDISRFYPTIYTHSIAWALHEKHWCKQNINKKALSTSLGQALDDLVRKGQDGQSLGIPLGPDTSIVLAEIIGVALDRELQQELSLEDEVAFRYTDDFFIGLRDGRTPEGTLAAVAGALSLFELEISSDKTRVISSAGRADPDWALEISQFRLPTDAGRKRKALEFYFKKAFHLAHVNSNQNVLSYCASRARTFDIDSASWSAYEEFLLQSGRANNTTIEMIARILIDGSRARMGLNSRWIERFICDQLQANAPLDHHWEVCWLLFLARELSIGLTDDLVALCDKIESSVVGLLLLDLGSRELANVGVLKHRIIRDLTPESLKSPEWLIVYEGARLGWLGEAAEKVVANDRYFASLSQQKIGFYDAKRTTRLIDKEKIGADPAHYDPSYFRF